MPAGGAAALADCGAAIRSGAGAAAREAAAARAPARFSLRFLRPAIPSSTGRPGAGTGPAGRLPGTGRWSVSPDAAEPRLISCGPDSGRALTGRGPLGRSWLTRGGASGRARVCQPCVVVQLVPAPVSVRQPSSAGQLPVRRASGGDAGARVGGGAAGGAAAAAVRQPPERASVSGSLLTNPGRVAPVTGPASAGRPNPGRAAGGMTPVSARRAGPGRRPPGTGPASAGRLGPGRAGEPAASGDRRAPGPVTGLGEAAAADGSAAPRLRPSIARPSLDRPAGSRSGTSRPEASRPVRSLAGTSRAGPAQSARSRAGASRREASRAGAPRPGISRPGTSRPGRSRPGSWRPGASRSGAGGRAKRGCVPAAGGRESDVRGGTVAPGPEPGRGEVVGSGCVRGGAAEPDPGAPGQLRGGALGVNALAPRSGVRRGAGGSASAGGATSGAPECSSNAADLRARRPVGGGSSRLEVSWAGPAAPRYLIQS